jgi:hypothetical protein
VDEVILDDEVHLDEVEIREQQQITLEIRQVREQTIQQ